MKTFQFMFPFLSYQGSDHGGCLFLEGRDCVRMGARVAEMFA